MKGKKTGGRKAGTPNRRSEKRKVALKAVADHLAAVIPGAFAADAHAFLMGIYKDPAQDIFVRIAAHSPQEVLIEQFLNPNNIGTIRLVASAANQSHFKMLVINNRTAEVAAFVDFENVFEFGRLVSAMALAIGHEPEGDFAAASQHLMDTTTVQQLLVLSQLDATDPLKV
jgi:hypothetical protein